MVFKLILTLLELSQHVRLSSRGVCVCLCVLSSMVGGDKEKWGVKRAHLRREESIHV